MRQVILVRHGEPVHVDADKGGRDPWLSERGVAQCAALTDALSGERIDLIWSSPLLRAVQTAEAVAGPRGMAIQIHNGLLELGHDGPYVPLEQTDDPSVRAFHERLRTQATDEPIQLFRRTVVVTIDEIVAGLPDGSTALISCHGGVVSAYASAVVGIADVIFFVAAYTGYSRFTVHGRAGAKMVSLNEHGHLGPNS